MTQAEIAAKIAAAREYLQGHRDEARYRDTVATAVPWRNRSAANPLRSNS